MEQELAYSFHLGSDKNKSKVAKKNSKKKDLNNKSKNLKMLINELKS